MKNKVLKCKNCKYFMASENMSLCKKNDSWEITKPDNKCWFLPEKKTLTCKDCWCLRNDMGCFGCSPDDSAYFDGKLCGGFIDIKEDLFLEILSHWKSRDIYDRNKINELIDAFEKNYNDLSGQI